MAKPGKTFDLADLRRGPVSAAGEGAMLSLILAWAHLDGALSLWVATKFEVSDDKMAILLGRADGKSKLLKLRRLYLLEGDAKRAAEIKRLADGYEKHVKPRNTVAHASLRGSLKSAPDCLVFAAYEPTGLGEMAIDCIPIQVMSRSTAWANRQSTLIEELLGLGE